MADAPNPSPSPAPEGEPSAQNKLILAYAGAAAKFITTASTDPEIQPIMATHGYDAPDLATGTGLIETLVETIQGRAEGKAQQTRATGVLNTTIAAERNTYAAFREIARAGFPEDADRQALSLTGNVPEDTGRFVILAKASYKAAQKAPYTEKMTKRNYAPARLDSMITSVGSVIAKGSQQDQSEGDAIGDTAARDAAYDLLRKWFKELKGVSRGALRGQHALLAKLDM